MDRTFLIYVFLVEGLWGTEATSVTGTLGGEVTIKCSHSYAISNVKYFCRGACTNADVLISSREKPKGRFLIKDEGNTFSVTICGLKREDSGTYWCGVERVGWDTYDKVFLTVTEEPDDKSKKANATYLEKLVYIGAGLGVVVLALAVVLLIFFRHRNRDVNRSSGKDHSTVYASSLKPNAKLATSPLAANEDVDTDDTQADSVFGLSADRHQDTSRDHADNCYSGGAISSEPQNQPDDPFYSLVSFNTHAHRSSAPPWPDVVTYSTITHTSRDEPAICCNL